MASSSSSPSSSSAPAKSSQPLHNFELSPMLRWNNNREGTSSGSGSHRRWRSTKPPHPQRPYDFPASPFRRSPPNNSFTPPPQPPRGSFMLPQTRFDSRIHDFSAPPLPRFQSPPPREAPPSRDQQPAAADDEIKESSAFDEEFQRLSLLREEEMRNYRGSDWWSEEGRSDITYRRNPHRRSGFSAPPARFGSSSFSFPDGRRHDAARGDFDAYHRNPYRRPNSFTPAGAGEAEAYNRQPFRFTSEPEEYRSDTYRRNSYRRTGFSPPMKQPYSPSSEGRRSGFSSPKRHEAHGYPRYPYANNSGFSSPPRRPPFYPVSSRAAKDEAYPRRQPLFSSSKTVAEAKPNPNPNPNPRFPARKFASSSNPEEKSKGKSKVVEEANAFASTTTTTRVAISSIPEERKADKVGAEIPKKEVRKPSFAPSSSSSAEAKLLKKGKAVELGEAGVKDSGKGKREEEKPKTGIKADDNEEIKVWNLRPRNVKGKGKANAGGGDKGNTPAGAKKGGGAAKAPAGVKGGGGEKKEKKKLSVEISLTKEEIEEDIFALTGARPSRRPKKWPKNVQKELDAVFPGLWLVNITPDSYKVSESSLK